MITLEEEFKTFLDGSFMGGSRGMPPEQREMLAMAFYGGARSAVTAITDEPMHLVSMDKELTEFIRAYEKKHGL